MTPFDLSPGQKAFLTGCWAASLAFTLVVLIGDAVRNLIWGKP